jgi:serine/threonine protein kinase
MKELTIGAVVGAGQFGEVFRGTWHHTTVAIKKLKVRV